MTPDINNDPHVLMVLAAAAVAAFALQTWRLRLRKPRDPEAPKENRWRNRWH